MSSYDELTRDYGTPRDTLTFRTVACVVVRVTPESVADDRPRLLVDLLEIDKRSPVIAALVAGQDGVDWRQGPPYPRETRRNLATGVVFPDDFTARVGRIAADDHPEGWDGDWCWVQFFGRQAVIVGWITPSYRNSDVADNQWTDPNEAKWLEPGTALNGAAQYDPATDELPVTNGNSYTDQWFTRYGRMLGSAWRRDGAAWELRDVAGDAVKANALVHVEATPTRIQARAPRVLVQFTDGTKALGIDTDAADQADTGLVLTPVVRHNQTLVVVARLQAEIDELRQIVANLAAGHTALIVDHKALQFAVSGLPVTGAVAIGVLPTTATVVNGNSVKPAPTGAELTAMRSLRVKAAP